MGIKNLLPNLKSIQQDKNIKEYQGQTVGVDGYVWLHAGIYTCVKEIVNKTPTNKQREVAQQKYEEAMKQGNYKIAYTYLAQTVSVTTQMAKEFIEEAKKFPKVKIIVSPYEADAQLAYMSQNNIIDVVITIDSDLLCFGSKKVFLKMDESGNGQEIQLENIKNTTEQDLSQFNLNMFTMACILSGCDYLPNIKNVGFKRACIYIQKHSNIENMFMEIGKKFEIPEGYIQKFYEVFLLFRFYNVYCPNQKEIISVNNLEDFAFNQYYQFPDHYFNCVVPKDIRSFYINNKNKFNWKKLLGHNPQFDDLNFVQQYVTGDIDPYSMQKWNFGGEQIKTDNQENYKNNENQSFFYLLVSSLFFCKRKQNKPKIEK